MLANAVSYETFRPHIQSGDLLAFSHRASMFASWYDFQVGIVRMFTRSEYSHVGIAWVVENRVFVLEAVRPMSRIYPLSRCGDFYHIATNVDWTNDVAEFAISHIGYEYDRGRAVEALFEDLAEDNFSECAAYALNVLRKAGIMLCKRAVPSEVVQAALEVGFDFTFVKGAKEEK